MATKPKPATTRTPSKGRKSSEPIAPPAAGIAAAQRLLQSVERRERTIGNALTRHRAASAKLKAQLGARDEQLKDLKADLKKVKKKRKKAAAA